MKHIYTSIVFLLLILSPRANAEITKNITAQDSTKRKKVEFKFGGRIDLMVFTDSYKSAENRGGVQYLYPERPFYNDKGEDIQFQNRLRASVAPTRLHLSVMTTDILKADALGYIETDFMGITPDVMYGVRLRHAYFRLKWKTNSLLLGQTNHLTMVEEMSANTVTFGGGYPLNPLSRPIQIRFSQDLGQKMNITAAAALFSGVTGENQSFVMLPDLQLKFTVGSASKLLVGAVGGVKVLRPRTLTGDMSKATATVTAFNAALFGRYSFAGGYCVKLFGIWGQDLSSLSIIGGYAPLLAEYSPEADYGYAPTSAYSVWADFESKKWKGWQCGIFAGMQQNLGTSKEVVVQDSYIPNRGIYRFWRVAPRIYYHHKGLTFGLEYMYSMATWSKQVDDYMRPTEKYPNTFNNRVTLLARFTF